MNLLDAIRSGRPFRRTKTHNVWLTTVDSCELRANEDVEALFFRTADGSCVSLMSHDLLADDWEIQEPTVTITRTQFLEAVDAVMPEIPGNALNYLARQNFLTLARFLGIGEGTK